MNEAFALIDGGDHSATGAWADLWESGRLEVTGDAELERVVLASQYYLLSSLPSPGSEAEFCGLSPGSLAYGDLGKDYQVTNNFLLPLH